MPQSNHNQGSEIRIDQPNKAIDLRSHFKVIKRNSKNQPVVPTASVADANPAMPDANDQNQTSIVNSDYLNSLYVSSIDTLQVADLELNQSSTAPHTGSFTRIDDNHSEHTKNSISSSSFIKRNSNTEPDAANSPPFLEGTDTKSETPPVVLEIGPPQISESNDNTGVGDRVSHPHELPVEALFQADEYRPSFETSFVEVGGESQEAAITGKTKNVTYHIGAAKFKCLESINPAWTVENYHWPSTVTELLRRYPDRFEAVGNAIKSALKNNQTAFAVTGLYRRQGQTTMSICLADWAAKNGLKCLLVDADLNQPGLALAAGLPRPINWRSAIREEEFVELALVHSISDSIDLMPQGESALHSSMMVDDWKILEQIISDFKPHYDLILVDLGPIREWIRTSVIRSIDGAISVSHAGIDQAALKGSFLTLSNRGIPVVAITENRSLG